MKTKSILFGLAVFIVFGIYFSIKYFSEENQNILKRSIDTTIGFKKGRVDVLASHDRPVMTWFKVEKLTTATATKGNGFRNYRFGYGIFDSNHNGKLDPSELQKGKKYFEVGPYTMYVYRDDS